MPLSSDRSDRQSTRQIRLWGFVLLALILLGLLISWGLPALLETRLPPNLRRSAQPSASPDKGSEAETEFVIVEYGNPAAEEAPEEVPDNAGEASPSPDMAADGTALENEPDTTNSTDASSDKPQRSDTPVRDTLQPSRPSSRTANPDPPPMQSLPGQRQLVNPPSLPPRSATITENTQQPAPPAMPPQTANKPPQAVSEKPAPAGSLRIWVGPFAGQEQARTASEKLSAAGHANQLITEGGGFRLRLNQAAATPDEALDLADAVALLGFEITVRKAE